MMMMMRTWREKEEEGRKFLIFDLKTISNERSKKLETTTQTKLTTNEHAASELCVRLPTTTHASLSPARSHVRAPACACQVQSLLCTHRAHRARVSSARIEFAQRAHTQTNTHTHTSSLPTCLRVRFECVRSTPPLEQSENLFHCCCCCLDSKRVACNYYTSRTFIWPNVTHTS